MKKSKKISLLIPVGLIALLLISVVGSFYLGKTVGEKIKEQMVVTDEKDSTVDDKVNDPITKTDDTVTEDDAEKSIYKNDNSSTKKEEFNYGYDTVAVVYEPDSQTRTGFKKCDSKASNCTVFGVKSDQLAKAIMGGKYKVIFNTFQNCKAAAGTKYCDVEGEVIVIPL
jgi:hypothetical protein